MIHRSKKIYARFARHHGKVRAAALTYNSILALIPFLILLSAVAGQFRFLELALSWLQYGSERFSLDLPLENYLPMVKHLQSLELRNLGIVGAGSLLLTLWMTLGQVEDALNHMFWVFKKRSLKRRLIVYTPFLALILLMLYACGLLMSHMGDWAFARLSESSDSFLEYLEWGGVFGFIGIWIWAVIFSLLWILPYTKTHWKSALISSIYTSIAWALLVILVLKTAGFLFVRYSVLYGSVSILPLALLFIYFSWYLILLGCAIAADLEDL
jgi:membrane protein